MTETSQEQRSDDPGVPEALPRMLVHVRDRLGVENVDRLWIFPGIRKGRREQGLVAVSCFLDAEERRHILTVAYSAERTGLSLTVDPEIHQEGEAPPELLGRVMEGVVRRAGQGHGDPREVEIDGDEERFDELMSEFDASLLAKEEM